MYFKLRDELFDRMFVVLYPNRSLITQNYALTKIIKGVSVIVNE